MKTILLLTPVQLENISFADQRIHFSSEAGNVIVFLNEKAEHAKDFEEIKDLKCAIVMGHELDTDETLKEELTKAQGQLNIATTQYEKLDGDFQEQAKNLTAANQRIFDLEEKLKTAATALSELEEKFKNSAKEATA